MRARTVTESAMREEAADATGYIAERVRVLRAPVRVLLVIAQRDLAVAEEAEAVLEGVVAPSVYDAVSQDTTDAVVKLQAHARRHAAKGRVAGMKASRKRMSQPDDIAARLAVLEEERRQRDAAAVKIQVRVGCVYLEWGVGALVVVFVRRNGRVSGLVPMMACCV